MPRKKVVSDTTKSVVTESDAVIKVSVKLPNKDSKDVEYRIPNINGQLIGAQRNPDTFLLLIKQILSERFGAIK